jgi:hypothetical protein
VALIASVTVIVMSIEIRAAASTIAAYVPLASD